MLFDEADALFVTDGRQRYDRYANIEVSYLLDRLRAYPLTCGDCGSSESRADPLSLHAWWTII
ncbi:MAG: hypothetical protein H6750_20555 [Nitrospiraceae bacterium]|nr:hypothetical protein [Nitrospiraceae bacterium]